MTETDLLANVLDACRTFGARTLHIRPARTDKGWRTPVSGDGKGFPDLLIVCRDGRILWRELKSAKGRLTHDQAAWLNDLHAAGQNVGVWRPEHWPEPIISEIRGVA